MDVIQFSICSEQATQQKLERIKQNKLQKDARGNGISATGILRLLTTRLYSYANIYM